MEEPNDLGTLAGRIAAERRANVLLFRGPIARDADGQLAPAQRQRAGRRDVILVLSTLGGSGDAAYRVMRSLQRAYERVTVVVDDFCKGAGTLLVVGADELVMSDFGELGPLDIHGGSPVQLGQMSSGLAPLQALRSLRAEALDLFEESYRQLRERGRPPLSTRGAAERASEIAVGLVSPISAQLDPGQIGEVERGVLMAREYARRIDRGNLKPGALDRLVSGYPSHDFVIDREEARDLYQRVRPPSPDEAALLTFVEPIMADRRNEGRFLYLDDVLGSDASGHVGTDEETDEDTGDTGADRSSRGASDYEGAGAGGANGDGANQGTRDSSDGASPEAEGTG